TSDDRFAVQSVVIRAECVERGDSEYAIAFHLAQVVLAEQRGGQVRERDRPSEVAGRRESSDGPRLRHGGRLTGESPAFSVRTGAMPPTAPPSAAAPSPMSSAQNTVQKRSVVTVTVAVGVAIVCTVPAASAPGTPTMSARSTSSAHGVAP